MTWTELWAFGRYDLGLSEEEFWSLTLREYSALADRFKDAQKWLDYRTALICSTIYNMLRGSQKALMPEYFMPGSKKRERQTPEQMLVTMNVYAAAYGDIIKKV